MATLLGLARGVAGAEFRGLGDLSGGEVRSEAADVSANGLVVVGSSQSSNGREAFRWTRETGMVGLGDLPGGAFDSFATAVSADGAVVVGGASAAPERSQQFEDGGNRAFKWTAAGGMASIIQRLQWWAGRNDPIHARGVSADGTVVVGVYYFQLPYAFRWTVENGATTGTQDYFNVDANDVSADGSVMVGTYGRYAWEGVWFDERGRHRVPPFGAWYSRVNAISPDGSVFGGAYELMQLGPSDIDAGLWKDGGVRHMVLGDLAGGRRHAQVLDLSEAGTIAVGFGHSESGKEAFVWDEENGMRSLQRVLVDELGLDLDGWRLESAAGVSDDGTVIVGTGVHDGATEGFIVVIPEPWAMAWVVGTIVLATWRPFRRMRWGGGRL